MNPILRNILAVIVGVFVGSAVNMALINLGPSVFPLPEGVDPNDFESIKAGIYSYELKHFIFPFLGHALGTLVGAFLAAKIAATHKMKFALAIGAWFLLGGITVNYMIGGPVWFIALDILLAYIPMGYLGGVFAGNNRSKL